MTPEQMKILRDAIAERDRHGTRGPVEAEHHSCPPGTAGTMIGRSNHSELVDDRGRTVLDTLNSSVAVIENPGYGAEFDRVGRADVDFVAAAWWGLPMALDEAAVLSTYLVAWTAAMHRLNEAGIADGPLDGRIAVVLAERDFAARRELKRMKERLTGMREECLRTFGGGYKTDAEREIFKHGMITVCNIIDEILRTP